MYDRKVETSGFYTDNYQQTAMNYDSNIERKTIFTHNDDYICLNSIMGVFSTSILYTCIFTWKRCRYLHFK